MTTTESKVTAAKAAVDRLADAAGRFTAGGKEGGDGRASAALGALVAALRGDGPMNRTTLSSMLGEYIEAREAEARELAESAVDALGALVRLAGPSESTASVEALGREPTMEELKVELASALDEAEVRLTDAHASVDRVHAAMHEIFARDPRHGQAVMGDIPRMKQSAHLQGRAQVMETITSGLVRASIEGHIATGIQAVGDEARTMEGDAARDHVMARTKALANEAIEAVNGVLRVVADEPTRCRGCTSSKLRDDALKAARAERAKGMQDIAPSIVPINSDGDIVNLFGGGKKVGQG